MIDERQLRLLRELVKKEASLREQNRPTDFLFLQTPGPVFGFKPGIDNEDEIGAMEGDLEQLAEEGFVRLTSGTSPSVVCVLTLTNEGRIAGQGGGRTVEPARPAPRSAPPNADQVLKWIYELSESPEGSSALADGDSLLNHAADTYDESHLETIADRIFDLGDSGLLLFEDPAATVEIDSKDRLGMAERFRLSTLGLDRVTSNAAPKVQNINQIINATNAQVAAGNINNFNSYDELLTHIADALHDLQDVDEEAREEALSLLEKLRSASGTVGTGVAMSGGGALLGTLLKKALGLE
jgi:hypothetical protein